MSDTRPFPSTPVFGALLEPLRTLPLPTPGPDASPGDRANTAVAYLTQHGSADDAEIREAIGLAKGKHLSMLAAEIATGRLHKDGDRWKPGPAPQAKQIDSVEKVDNIIVATKDASPVPQAVVHAIAAAPAAPSIEQYRCAHWSDGTIELQLNGEEVARLSEHELDFINAFLAKRWAA